MASKKHDRETEETGETAYEPAQAPFAEPPPVVAPSNALPPDEYLTEQEKDAVGGGNGVGPMTPSEESPPLETMEDLGIHADTPYPVDNPPPPEEGVTAKKGK